MCERAAGRRGERVPGATVGLKLLQDDRLPAGNQSGHLTELMASVGKFERLPRNKTTNRNVPFFESAPLL